MSRKVKSDDLAGRINNNISGVEKKRLARLAIHKELWSAVKDKSNARHFRIDPNVGDPDIVNNDFGGIATDDCYVKSEVTKFLHMSSTKTVTCLATQSIKLNCVCTRLGIHLQVLQV